MWAKNRDTKSSWLKLGHPVTWHHIFVLRRILRWRKSSYYRHKGQDGAYLAQFLLDKGYEVFGGDRRNSEQVNWRLVELNVHDRINFRYFDLCELTNIMDVISKVQPDEIYNLGAQSFVSSSFEQPLVTANVDALGVLRVLEAVRILSPKSKFYQASTSEMFGKVRECLKRS